MSITANSITAMLELNTDPFARGLASAKQQLATFNDSSKNAGTRVEALGGAMSATGGVLTKALTVPVLGIGIAATKVTVDFEAQMSRVQAISGATGGDFEKLRDQAKDLGASTSFSAKEAAEGMENLASAGFDTNQIMSAMPGLLDLAASDNLDLATAADIAASTLNGFGLEAGEAARVADILAKAAADTNAGIADTGEAMKYVAPVASAMGISIEETTAAIGLLSNAGIKGGQAGTVLRGALSKLAKPSKEAAELMENLGFKAYDSQGKMLPLKDIIGNLQTSMSSLTDEQKQNAIVTMFGQESMSGMLALIEAGPEELENLTTSLENSDGAAKKMADTMMNNTKGAWDEFTSALEGAGIAIGEIILPKLTSMLKGVTNLVNSFTKLDDGTKKFIVTAGLVVGAIGPLLIVGGKVASGIGSIMSLVTKLVPAIGGSGLTGMISGLSTVALPLVGVVAALGAGFYVWHEANDAATRSLTKSSEEMSFTERIMAKLSGQTVYTKEELENMGLVYEDFNENISPEFQDRVKEMTTDVHDFGMTLGEINFDGVITDEEAGNLSSRVSEALQSCLGAIDEKKAEMQSGLSEAFNIDGVIDENEKSLLEYWDSRGNKEKEEAQKLQDEINNIINTARTEGRELTPEEVEAIENYYAQIKQIELEAQANNSYELEYAQKEFQNRVTTLDAENAEKLLGERHKQFEEQKIETKTNYDTLIALAQENYSNLSDEDKKNADDTIARLTAAKEEELRVNKEKYDADIQYAEEHNKNLTKVFNKYTGQMVEGQDEVNYKIYEKMRNHYLGINDITTSGYKKLYDTSTFTWKDVYVSIDETTGDLKGVYDLNSTEVGTMTAKDEDNLRDELLKWNETAEGILANCLVMGEAYLDSSGQISDAAGNIIGSLEEVEDENGNVIRTIKDVNGNPIQIGENTDKVVEKLKNTQREVDKTNGKKATIYLEEYGYSNILKKINSFQNYSVTIPVTYKSTNGPIRTYYATGTDHSLSGLAEVAEYGPELIQDRNGLMTLATSRQVVDMQGGETVYNARQTKEILKGMDSAPLLNEDASKLLQTVIIKLDEVKKVINEKELNNVTNNNISSVEVNGVTDVRDIIEEITEYTELRKI